MRPKHKEIIRRIFEHLICDLQIAKSPFKLQHFKFVAAQLIHTYKTNTHPSNFKVAHPLIFHHHIFKNTRIYRGVGYPRPFASVFAIGVLKCRDRVRLTFTFEIYLPCELFLGLLAGIGLKPIRCRLKLI